MLGRAGLAVLFVCAGVWPRKTHAAYATASLSIRATVTQTCRAAFNAAQPTQTPLLSCAAGTGHAGRLSAIPLEMPTITRSTTAGQPRLTVTF